MTLLVAPDSFKGTFAAAVVAEAIASGIEDAGGVADRCPVADGGEGTLAVLLSALGGERVEVVVRDPLGRSIRAVFGLVDDGATAIVEVALASGLGLVAPAERDPEAASTVGTGELIVAAARRPGVKRVLVAVGGSATTDGGAGALEAVEAAGGIGDVALVVLCDVTIPFERAAEVFGPQKGADPTAVARLAARLEHHAAALPRDPRGRPMTGAAGGLAGGLWAALGAELRAGAPFVLDALGFDERLAVASAVISGEGRLDAQTLKGKIVGEVARRARRAGVPLHLVVGSATLTAEQLIALDVVSVREASDETALRRAGHALMS